MSIKYVCTWREEAIKKEKRSHQKTKKINEEKYLRISRPYQKKRERRKESKWTKQWKRRNNEHKNEDTRQGDKVYIRE